MGRVFMHGRGFRESIRQEKAGGVCVVPGPNDTTVLSEHRP